MERKSNGARRKVVSLALRREIVWAAKQRAEQEHRSLSNLIDTMIELALEGLAYQREQSQPGHKVRRNG